MAPLFLGLPHHGIASRFSGKCNGFRCSRQHKKLTWPRTLAGQLFALWLLLGDSSLAGGQLTQQGEYKTESNHVQAVQQKALEQTRYEAVQAHMGVRFKIVIYADSDLQAEQAIDAAYTEIARMNRLFSDYDPESELSRLGAESPSNAWIMISPEFWELLKTAEGVSRASDGAFDITLGPLTKLWRRSRRDGSLPEDSVLQAAIKQTGFEQLIVDRDQPRVQLQHEGMQLDAGGIAKGFAADRALAVLKSHGIESALIDASGDITLGAAPPHQDGWKVGIAPLDANTPVSRKIVLANCAVATSGDAWQAIEINGERYSHIIDPQTGLGLKHRSSVTVIAPTGALADAWASALSVLGPDKGIEVINRHDDLQAWVVTLRNGKPQVSISEGFPATEPVEAPNTGEAVNHDKTPDLDR